MKRILVLLGLLIYFVAQPPPVKADSLAVDFTYFEASVVGQAVEINFTTEGVHYPEYFFIESLDHTGNWQEIEGSHITPKQKQAADYKYVYRQPPEGFIYLRVGQKDYDGNFYYTNATDVFFESSGIAYYPNPTTDKLTIYPKPDKIFITDMVGRTTEAVPDFSGAVSLNQYPPGRYSVQSIYPDHFSKSAIIQRE